MEKSGSRSSRPTRTGAICGSRDQATDTSAEVVAVPILSLRPGDSPRLNGQDKAHIARLADTETPLPPIIVDKRTMRVIDGMHRLMAASMRGRETIDVVFCEGSEADMFLRAVQENVRHGLPLSHTDRRAAAERIISSHPHMSDRAIGQSAGLAAKTVAAIRKRSGHDAAHSSTRIGQDGKVRPLDSSEGRRRAAELLNSQPEASLRDVARAAGISPGTVLDVRNRLKRGEPPVPVKPVAREGQPVLGLVGSRAGNQAPGRDASALSPRAPAVVDAASTVEKLLRDPSLRNNDQGKGILRLLHINAVGAEQLPEVAATVPPHCVIMVAHLARLYAKMWHNFALEMDGRARIMEPSTAAR